MKKRIIIFSLLIIISTMLPLSGQTFYDQQWLKIENQTEKGQFKSNLPLVLEIQKRAMKDQNITELIKALKVEFQILENTFDDNENNSISQFYTKIDKASQEFSGSKKAIIQLLKVKLLDNYFDNNAWQISSRTNVENNNLYEVETWSRLAFKNHFTEEFQKIFSNPQLLKSEDIKVYKGVFNNEFNVDFFSSFYEFASLQQIDFLKNSELFTNNELKENRFKIHTIYDALISENKGNSKLYFQHQKLKFDSENKSNNDNVQDLENLLKSNVSGDYKVIIANDLSLALIDKNQNVKALNVLKQYQELYPKSSFINNLKNTELTILQPSVNVNYERFTAPNRPIQLVAETKNLDSFSINVYEVKKDFEGFLGFINDSYRTKFSDVKKTLVRKEEFKIKNLGDYKGHKTSVAMQSLEPGVYMLEFLVNGNNIRNSDDYLVVSNAKSVYKNIDEKDNIKNQLLWINSDNGEVIANENLKISAYIFDKPDITKVLKLGNDGTFVLPFPNRDVYSSTFLIRNERTGDSELKHVYNYRRNYNNNEIKEVTKAQIFLDRAIYRPGQLVYFKVINTQLKQSKESVLPNVKQEVTLLDANNKKVSSSFFVSNNFGSYHGSFVLPKGLLNGSFKIKVTDVANRIDVAKHFNVEEYKRPNFEVNFDPIQGEYRYGQKLELKGKVSTFSGLPVNGVKVNFEIKKQNLRWRYFPWYPQDSRKENSIILETITNDKGEFSLILNLEKDESLEGLQVDNYRVNASVTDVNGETQFANTNVTVASVSHYIETPEIENKLDNQSIKINVDVKNYNGQLLQKEYQVKLLKLKDNDRIFRDNFLNYIQDNPNMTKEDFVKLFPNDRYDKFDLDINKEPESVVLYKTFKDNQIDLGTLSSGSYRLELFNIEGKDTIKISRDFQVFNENKLNSNQKNFLELVNDKTEYKSGDKGKLRIYSAVPNATLHIYTQTGDGKTNYISRRTENGLFVFDYDIPKDTSVFNIQVLLAAYNDVQLKSINIPVISNEEKLKIETLTFREKLQPNVKEKWSVRVLGNTKEKINAEVLVTMYDKSLDLFRPNNFDFSNIYLKNIRINSYDINKYMAQFGYYQSQKFYNTKDLEEPFFNWFYNGLVFSNYAVTESAVIQTKSMNLGVPPPPELDEHAKREKGVVANESEDLSQVKLRENLNETAFFYPSLLTDKDGNVNFEFTSPEALTQWKLMFLAHTIEAKSAILEKTVVTQKEFSVSPNYPRFLREGDVLDFQSKLSSFVNQPLVGSAQLTILDASTNEDITSQFQLDSSIQNFKIEENTSKALSWRIKVPSNIEAVIFKIIAKSGGFSDGEQKSIAVLPNRMLVTDALPIFVKEGETKTFVLENLKNNKSKTITNFSNTLELTTNPIWEIMFALPSLKNDQNQSADIVFNKWFADVLAAEIFKANPKLKAVFEEYQSKGLLQSNLDKNQELKQLLLEETPWVFESNNEEMQMQQLARLFDANTMRQSINKDWDELVKLQNIDGGFSWYQGYPSSFSTSLYILKNLGKINGWLKASVTDYQAENQSELVSKLVNFVDVEIGKYWQNQKEKPWSNTVFNYLDSRHYWEQYYPLKSKGLTLKKLVVDQANKAKIQDFTFFGLHRAAVLFDFYGLEPVAKKLLTYLKETSTDSKTQGVYWKQNLNDWGWYGSKIANHAGAIDVFNQLMPHDTQFLEELKIWLITQKEVNAWQSSRDTAEVIFTILNSGKSWTLAESDKATVIWGGKHLVSTDAKSTGYVKSNKKSTDVNKQLGEVTITKPGAGIVQGGLFWQYFEDLDQIKSSESYIAIHKEYYKKIKTQNGEELKLITKNTPIAVGDRLTVRLILNTDRAMEYIHLKDMRASGLEPINVISRYQWKNNLAYYESTKDAATNFYIEYMPKGKYVFEYDLVANTSGEFSNGITTLQNFYAPQMNSHSKGSKIVVNQ